MATAKKMKRKRVPWLPSSRSEWHVSQRRWQPTPTNPIYTSMMMSKVLCEHSRRSFLHQVLSSKRATVARDEVHHSVCCLLVVPRPARLSRGRPRPCSRRLPAKSAVFFFFFSLRNTCSDLKCGFVRVDTYQILLWVHVRKTGWLSR